VGASLPDTGIISSFSGIIKYLSGILIPSLQLPCKVPYFCQTACIVNMKSLLQNDLPASVVVFLVALPLCLGIALGSGAPPMSGIIAGVIGGVVVGALSGSPISVSGPAAGLTSIVLAAITDLGSFELFLTAVVLAGVFQILFGLAKFGTVGHYVPNTVIKGMMAAIGLILIMKQIPHLVGYDVDFMGDENFEQPTNENTFTGLLHALWRISPPAAVIGSLSLLVMFLADATGWAKKTAGRLLPAALIAVVLGLVLVPVLQMLGPDWFLAASHKVELGTGFRTWNTPNWQGLSDRAVWIVALTIALVASLESLLSIEAADKLDPLKRVTPTNRELLAQGAGNALSGLVGGLPITSVVVRTSVNAQSGAQSKSSAIFHGLILALAVVVAKDVLNAIPKASLAAILIFTGYKLAHPKVLKAAVLRGRGQWIPFVATVAAILLSDLLVGIAIGLVVSVLFIAFQAYHATYAEVRKDNLVLFRLRRNVSFLNKGGIKTRLEAIPPGSEVLLDISHADYIDPDVEEVLLDYCAHAHLRNIQVACKKNPTQSAAFDVYAPNPKTPSHEPH
jgi:MFS superfamily sulfate permease-like transporter